MQIWDLNLRHLAAIVGITELGTMNAAAQAVNLTQPAITQALERIERLTATQLFERRHNGMVPTDATRLLAPRIAAALDHIASPHVTMSRLRALLALADSGSYNGASFATGLSVPSLHRAVNDLSLALRRPLVERRGKVAILTDAGAVMARAFRLARVELEAGLAELQALKGHETRSIAVGAMPLSRARVLPAAITRFLRQRPQVRISVIEGSRAELVEPLRNGAIDLMIGALRDPLAEADLVQQPLFVDVPAVIARRDHPLANRDPALADLAAYPWVVAAPGAPLRDIWEQMFARADVDLPPVPVVCGSALTIRQILVDSDFLTLLSPDQVAVELELGWLTALCPAPAGLERTIGVTTRSSWRPTSVQAEFVAALEQAARPVRPAGLD
jgi:DNA-binding transcriptional LysR family regulator